MAMNSEPPVTETSQEEPDPSAERLAYSVDEAARLTGLSRAFHSSTTAVSLASWSCRVVAACSRARRRRKSVAGLPWRCLFTSRWQPARNTGT